MDHPDSGGVATFRGSEGARRESQLCECGHKRHWHPYSGPDTWCWGGTPDHSDCPCTGFVLAEVAS